MRIQLEWPLLPILGMKLGWILNLFICLALGAPLAHANPGGVLGASGNLGGAASAGALANRQMADQLFKDSLENERDAYKSFPPDVSKLAQALTQAMNGMQANNQSRAMADNALQSFNSGEHSGYLDHEFYNTNKQQMQKISATSSPYLPHVKSKLEGYGIEVSPDYQSIKTPFGEFPMDASPETIAAELSKVAQSFGASAGPVQAGVRSAIEGRDQLAAEVTMKSQEYMEQFGEFNTAGGYSNSVSAPESSYGEDSDSDDSYSFNRSEDSKKRKKTSSTNLASLSPKGVQQHEKKLENYRRKLMRKMGLSKYHVIGHRDDNLFEMVHQRYQRLNRQNRVLKTNPRHLAQFN